MHELARQYNTLTTFVRPLKDSNPCFTPESPESCATLCRSPQLGPASEGAARTCLGLLSVPLLRPPAAPQGPPPGGTSAVAMRLSKAAGSLGRRCRKLKAQKMQI